MSNIDHQPHTFIGDHRPTYQPMLSMPPIRDVTSDTSDSTSCCTPARSASNASSRFCMHNGSDGFIINDVITISPMIDANPSVTRLCSRLQEIRSGKAFIVDSDIPASTIIRRDYPEAIVKPWHGVAQTSEVERLQALPGCFPPAVELRRLLHLAIKHIRDSCSDDYWSYDVHYELLGLIFRSGPLHRPNSTPFLLGPWYVLTRYKQVPAFPRRMDHSPSNSINAELDSQWVEEGAELYKKKIDFCLHVNIGFEDGFQRPMNAEILKNMGVRAAGPTSYAPFAHQPIILMVVGKGYDGSSLDAFEQIKTWHLAQWRYFIHLLAYRWMRENSHISNNSAPEELEARDKFVNDTLDKLPCIPGVVINGERWMFVLSRRCGKRIRFQHEIEFGTTRSILDICKVVTGLREIAGWLQDVYLPWLRNDLGLRVDYNKSNA